METRELFLRRTLPVFINSFNQPTYLRNIIEKLILEKFSNIYILDNDSTSHELLDYYSYIKKEMSKAFILYYNSNNGPRYFHLSGTYEKIGCGNTPHIYTDPDLDFDYLANDFLTQLLELTERYQTPKVGCALKIPSNEEVRPDLFFTPPHLGGKKIGVIDWEKQFWENQIEMEIYHAPIDTTLHLFNPKYFSHKNPKNYLTGIRVAKKGFLVKHRPWYKTDPIPKEEVEFYRTTGQSHSSWMEEKH